MDLIKAIKERRSIRVFKKKKIPLDTVKQMIQDACWAPSACNRQFWKFVIIEDSKLKKKIADAGVDLTLKAPVSIAVFYHRKVNETNSANIQSASAAIQNLLLIAKNKGIGSLWASSPCRNKKKISEILKVPDDFRLISFVFLGYAESTPPAPPRKSIDEVIGIDRFPGASFPVSVLPEDWSLENIKDFQKYSCRAKDLGSVYLHFPENAKSIVSENIASEISANHIDLFSYDGTLLSLLAKNKKSYAFEMSQEVIYFIKMRLLKENLQKNVSFLKETKLENIKPQTFDSASLILKLGMLNSKEQKKIISQISRILKKKGILFLLYRNKFSLTWLKALYRLHIKKQNTVNNPYIALYNFGPYSAQNNGKIKKIILNNFSIKKKQTFGFLPHKRSIFDFIAPFCEYQLLVLEKK